MFVVLIVNVLILSVIRLNWIQSERDLQLCFLVDSNKSNSPLLGVMFSTPTNLGCLTEKLFDLHSISRDDLLLTGGDRDDDNVFFVPLKGYFKVGCEKLSLNDIVIRTPTAFLRHIAIRSVDPENWTKYVVSIGEGDDGPEYHIGSLMLRKKPCEVLFTSLVHIVEGYAQVAKPTFKHLSFPTSNLAELSAIHVSEVTTFSPMPFSEEVSLLRQAQASMKGRSLWDDNHLQIDIEEGSEETFESSSNEMDSVSGSDDAGSASQTSRTTATKKSVDTRSLTVASRSFIARNPRTRENTSNTKLTKTAATVTRGTWQELLKTTSFDQQQLAVIRQMLFDYGPQYKSILEYTECGRTWLRNVKPDQLRNFVKYVLRRYTPSTVCLEFMFLFSPNFNTHPTTEYYALKTTFGGCPDFFDSYHQSYEYLNRHCIYGLNGTACPLREIPFDRERFLVPTLYMH